VPPTRGLWILVKADQLIHDFVQHFLGDVDRQMRVASHGHRDGVDGRESISISSPFQSHAQLGVVGVFAEFADHHAVELTTQGVDHAD